MIPSEANVTERSQAQERSKGTRGLLSALLMHHGQKPKESALPMYAAKVSRLWGVGKNTAEIATEIGVKEHELANRLPAILAWRRQLRGGGHAITRS